MVDAYEFIRSHQVILAPMAGITDKAMRILCREQGAQLAYTEMVSSKGLSFANSKTVQLLDLDESEQQVAVQLFGHEPDTMADQAKWVEQELGPRLAAIDINMGCPARKIVRKGDGAALMEQPDLARKIICKTSEAVQVPVSVKFRRGYAQGNETAPDFARMAEEAGAAWVCVHGRFAEQMYRGFSERGAIARVKQAVKIPVVGNGDVCSGDDALALLEDTGCDAIMVARAAQGNPWVFADIRAALQGSTRPLPPAPHERIALAKRHARLIAQEGQRGVVRMRKHASWYCKGLEGASQARKALNECSTLVEFDAVFDTILDRLGHAQPEAQTKGCAHA